MVWTLLGIPHIVITNISLVHTRDHIIFLRFALSFRKISQFTTSVSVIKSRKFFREIFEVRVIRLEVTDNNIQLTDIATCIQQRGTTQNGTQGKLCFITKQFHKNHLTYA